MTVRSRWAVWDYPVQSELDFDLNLETRAGLKGDQLCTCLLLCSHLSVTWELYELVREAGKTRWEVEGRVRGGGKKKISLDHWGTFSGQRTTFQSHSAFLPAHAHCPFCCPCDISGGLVQAYSKKGETKAAKTRAD